ncbi:MAG: viroplasmin family protein, partial [Chloroflexi bacterium]|nr:viroplasmin family protein [Chloroflexota bacterium]
MAKKNYYAVRVGRVPGIYKTWDECSAQVTGFAGAHYRGFNSLLDAEKFLG